MTKGKSNFKATGTWVALIDPREPEKAESVVQLLDETKEYMAKDTNDIETNLLEVHSVGELVTDKRIRASVGKHVVVDPRMPVAIIALDDNPNIEAEYVMVVQENQVMMA